MNTGQGITVRKHPEVYARLATRVVHTLYPTILLPKGERNNLIEIAKAIC